MNSSLDWSNSMMRSATRENELPAGTSFSSINFGDEQGDKMRDRYRSDGWQSMKARPVFVPRARGSDVLDGQANERFPQEERNGSIDRLTRLRQRGLFSGEDNGSDEDEADVLSARRGRDQTDANRVSSMNGGRVGHGETVDRSGADKTVSWATDFGEVRTGQAGKTIEGGSDTEVDEVVARNAHQADAIDRPRAPGPKDRLPPVSRGAQSQPNPTPSAEDSPDIVGGITIPETDNDLVKDFAAQLRKVAELNSSISSIDDMSRTPATDANTRKPRRKVSDEQLGGVDDLNESDDLRGYSQQQLKSPRRPKTRTPRALGEDASTKPPLTECAFPSDLYDDVFTPNSDRRQEYLGTSNLSHIISGLSATGDL
jgi:hypothetical protein